MLKSHKNKLEIAASVLAVTLVLDLMILFTSIGQVAIEGRSGEWNSFWRWQGQQIVKVLELLS